MVRVSDLKDKGWVELKDMERISDQIIEASSVIANPEK
jgi:hypothetical protein